MSYFYQRSRRDFSDTPFGMVCIIVMSAVIFIGVAMIIQHLSQLRADSLNSMTGSNYTAEDIMLNGDRIIVIPK